VGFPFQGIVPTGQLCGKLAVVRCGLPGWLVAWCWRVGSVSGRWGQVGLGCLVVGGGALRVRQSLWICIYTLTSVPLAGGWDAVYLVRRRTMSPKEIQKLAKEPCEKCGSVRGHSMEYIPAFEGHRLERIPARDESMVLWCKTCGFCHTALL
jgi:hypothetical protein